MKKMIFALFALFAVLVSCDKDKTVVLTQSGMITIMAADKGSPIADAKVELSMLSDYGYYYEYDQALPPPYYETNFIFEGKTDASGKCVTETLIQGSYYCAVSVKKGKVTYVDRRAVQVITGENKTIEVNPIANSGTLNFTVLNAFNYDAALASIGFGLVYYSDYYDASNDLSTLKSKALFLGVTNAEGKLSFPEFPAENSVMAFAYKGDKILDGDLYIYLPRGEQSKDYTVRIYNY